MDTHAHLHIHTATHYDSLWVLNLPFSFITEDESEISFEPGDIISAVETVDKAWWQGCTKDGRQGLFPANYVETI